MPGPIGDQNLISSETYITRLQKKAERGLSLQPESYHNESQVRATLRTLRPQDAVPDAAGISY